MQLPLYKRWLGLTVCLVTAMPQSGRIDTKRAQLSNDDGVAAVL